MFMNLIKLSIIKTVCLIILLDLINADSNYVLIVISDKCKIN